ncbi:MAG: hypothetical protein U0414_12125 [Polyangiaceae bacterium]
MYARPLRERERGREVAGPAGDPRERDLLRSFDDRRRVRRLEGDQERARDAGRARRRAREHVVRRSQHAPGAPRTDGHDDGGDDDDRSDPDDVHGVGGAPWIRALAYRRNATPSREPRSSSQTSASVVVGAARMQEARAESWEER